MVSLKGGGIGRQSLGDHARWPRDRWEWWRSLDGNDSSGAAWFCVRAVTIEVNFIGIPVYVITRHASVHFGGAGTLNWFCRETQRALITTNFNFLIMFCHSYHLKIVWFLVSNVRILGWIYKWSTLQTRLTLTTSKTRETLRRLYALPSRLESLQPEKKNAPTHMPAPYWSLRTEPYTVYGADWNPARWDSKLLRKVTVTSLPKTSCDLGLSPTRASVARMVRKTTQ
jgi:hypothetical protein